MKKTDLIRFLYDAEPPITKSKVIDVIHSVTYNDHSMAQKSFQNDILSKFAHQLPAHVFKIMNVYGLDLLIEHFGLDEYYHQKMNDAFYELDIIDGLEWITDFFNNFRRRIEQIRADYLPGRKRDDLSKLKEELIRLQQISKEEVLELELKRHRVYIPEYLALIESEIQNCFPATESINPDRLDTIASRFRSLFQPHGFFQLPLVAALKSEFNKDALLNLIYENELPYQIALLHFLGFLTHLQEVQHFSKERVYHFLAEVFQVNHRAIKGNILVLSRFSKENKTRYTSYRHIESVESDYKILIKNTNKNAF